MAPNGWLLVDFQGLTPWVYNHYDTLRAWVASQDVMKYDTLALRH